MFEVLKSDSVPIEDTFTAAYNAIRLLQYRTRLKPQLYGQFLKEHEATASDEIISLALQVISEIEQHENAKIAGLENRVARKYESALASLAEKRAKQELTADPKRSRQLLRQLEKDVVTP